MHFVDCGSEPASLQPLVKYDPNGNPVWDASGSRGSDFYRDLGRPFENLCGYCERPCSRQSGKLDANEVEHFRPRVHFPELTFTWENLIYVCRRCNLAKGDQFPGITPLDANAVNLLNWDAERCGKQFVDPSEADGYVNPRDPVEKAEDFFVFDRLGQILPNPDLDNRRWSKARRTIGDFNLNSVGGPRAIDLCNLRSVAFKQCEDAARVAARGNTRKAEKLAALSRKLTPGFPSLVNWVFGNALNQS